LAVFRGGTIFPVLISGASVTQPRVADDFGTIRTRLEDLRRERARARSTEGGEQNEAPQPKSDIGDSRVRSLERRRKDRFDGTPPPWVPTIFLRK